METTKYCVIRAAKVANLIMLMAGIAASAILQDQIGKLSPDKSAATELQSWMTFFTLVFLFFGITEVYDETELMLFKPKQL